MDYLARLFDTSGFPRRWECGDWSEALGWLHVLSDVAIFGAYLAIPLVLVYFVSKRDNLPFPRIFWLFGLFIFFCGAGHLIEASLFWSPWYRFSGAVKFVTAIVSWITVIALFRVVPRGLALTGLARTNETLRHEIEARKEIEERLLSSSAELDRSNRDLGRLNNVMLDREDHVLELKAEINGLLNELGRPTRYESAT